jgi:hypothetical protein
LLQEYESLSKRVELSKDVLSPSPLNGERVGVRGENVIRGSRGVVLLTSQSL